MPNNRFIVIVFIYFLVLPTMALATEERDEKDSGSILGLVIENDSFTGTDKNYTNGIRFSMLSSEDKLPHWINSLASALPLADNGNKRISIAAGQNMYTPTDITQKNPPTTEQPYAGWLYGSVGIVSDTGKALDNVMLTLGMVGPLSYAEQTQKIVHNLIDSPYPQGWRHQLKNEPGIILTYEHKWRQMYEFSPFGVGIDITPHLGGDLGNVNTDAIMGATFRLGYDLPADYGPPRVRPSLPGSDFFIPTQKLGGYIFTTFAEQAVARNIFLDGNTFTSSPHVDKEILVSSLQSGVALTYKEARVSYTQVYISKQYATEEHPEKFGVLTFSWRF